MRTLYLLFVLGTVITGSVKAADPHEIVGWGQNNKGQLDIPSGQFQVIAAGLRHSLGVTLDGEIMGWGENNRGQINIPSGQFQDVAAGEAHSLGLTTDGQIRGWGLDYWGQSTPPPGSSRPLRPGVSTAWVC